jgi:hypothetical protein
MSFPLSEAKEIAVKHQNAIKNPAKYSYYLIKVTLKYILVLDQPELNNKIIESALTDLILHDLYPWKALNPFFVKIKHCSSTLFKIYLICKSKIDSCYYIHDVIDEVNQNVNENLNKNKSRVKNDNMYLWKTLNETIYDEGSLSENKSENRNEVKNNNMYLQINSFPFKCGRIIPYYFKINNLTKINK